MSKSAFSLRVFSIYLFALGSVLVAAPNLMLSFFGIPETHEVWIRVVGVPLLVIGYLAFMASGIELRVFFAGQFKPGWQFQYFSVLLLHWVLHHQFYYCSVQ